MKRISLKDFIIGAFTATLFLCSLALLPIKIMLDGMLCLPVLHSIG